MRLPSSRALFAAVAVVVTTGCTASSEVEGSDASIEALVHWPAGAQTLTATRQSVSAVLIELRRGDVEIVFSETRGLSASLDEIPLEFSYPVRGSSETLTLIIRLRDGAATVYRAETVLALTPNEVETVTLTAAYAGPGADATTFTLSPALDTIPYTSTVSLEATARNINGVIVGTPVHWSLSDPTLGTLTQTGEFTGAGITGPVTITALAATGHTAQSTLTLRTVAEEMVSLGGTGQTALPTAPYPTPLSVVVRAGGVPVPGLEIAWRIHSGSAQLSSSFSVTNADGVAAITVDAGTFAGDVSISASVDTLSVPFTLTVERGPAAIITELPPVTAGLEEFVNQMVRRPATAVVTDAFGNVLADIPVTFAVSTGQGSVTTAATVSTTADGRATAGWRLGPVFGDQTLQATTPCTSEGGCLSVDMTRFAVLANANSITFVSGDGEDVPVGSPVEVRMRVVEIVPIANVPFTISLTAGVAELSAFAGVTDAAGEIALTMTPHAPGVAQARFVVDYDEFPKKTGSANVTATPLGYTHAWLGNSANWHEASNWSAGTVPTAADSVIVAAGTDFGPVLSANAEVGSLYHDDSLAIDLAGHVLSVHGSVISSSAVSGGRVALLKADGFYLSGGFDSLHVVGTGALTSVVSAARLEMESGSELDIGVSALTISDSTIFRGGFLRMNTASAFTILHHVVFASGTMTDDLLTAGRMLVTGDLVAPGSFRSSGEHLVTMETTAGVETRLDIRSVGDTGSRMANLWINGGLVAVTSDLQVIGRLENSGTLSVPAGVSLTVGGELRLDAFSSTTVNGTVSYGSCVVVSEFATVVGFTCQ